MIIDSPTISQKLSSKEKVRERNDYKEDNNVEKFTHEKLPKVYVVVMHDTLKKVVQKSVKTSIMDQEC